MLLCTYFYIKNWKISKAELKIGSVPGLLLFLAFASQTLGLQYTTASKQGFLTATYVVMVPFLYWLFYKKHPPFKAIIGSLITILGIGLVSYTKDMVFNVGDALTLLCALLFAAHILSLEYYTKNISYETFIFTIGCCSSLVCCRGICIWALRFRFV